MVDEADIDYFTARAVAERELSEGSSNEVAAQVHRTLAERYERLAARSTGRPILHIVAPQPR